MSDRTPDTALLTTNAGGQLVLRSVRVTVVEGPDAGLSIELDRGTRVVGSGASADLRVSDPRVSRAHVELALLAPGVLVRDLESRNGTFVGDAKVREVVLPARGFVRLGKATVLEIAPVDTPVAIAARSRLGDLVATSASMTAILGLLAHVAETESPVLLEGEEGVGKTAAAHAMHAQRGELRTIDLSLEAQIEAPSAGTLLLERVDHASTATQARLRALLEAREADRGGPRIVATAREDVRALVSAGAFSRDLYFHLGVVHVRLPPLRDRPEDVPVLLDSLRARYGSAVSPSELAELRSRGFPGNVRALRSVAMPDSAGEPVELGYREARERALERFEHGYLEQLLAEHRGNVSKAARAAGMSRSHLIDLLKKRGLA